jgi:predicted dehydrogenase/nucleoside-diphosphate-sugar epimerase
MSKECLQDSRLAFEPFRWLVLGGGAVVANLHVPALDALGWLNDSTVIEPDEGSVKQLQKLFPKIKVCQCGFESALADPAIGSFDAVLVALPNSLHFEASSGALARGFHVLCEKPLSLDSASCEELARIAAKANRRLGAAMVRRYLPSLRAMRVALCKGLIGQIRSIEMEDGAPYAWSADSSTIFRRDQGGVLVNMGVHFLDYLAHMFGSLQPVSYQDDALGGIEANCIFQLRTVTDIPLRLQISGSRKLGNQLRVHGETGTLIVEKDRFDVCRWESADGRLKANLSVQDAFESGNWKPTFESCFVEQFWQFAKAVRTNGAVPVDGMTAASTLKLIEWAYENRHSLRVRCGAPTHNKPRPVLKPDKVVVTGGTGFVGGALVHRLTELGFENIVVPVRSYRTGANVARFPVLMQRTDLLNPEQVHQTMAGARYVFHLAYGLDGPDPAKVTIDGTMNVIRAAIAGGAEAVVVFSTCSVYGHPHGICTEESLHRPALGEYGFSKSEMEKRCLDLALTQSTPRVVILQPGAVFGPQGPTFTELPCRLAAAGAFCWFDNGAGNANFVYVDNLVDAAIIAAASPIAAGKRYIIVDGVCTWREFLSPLLTPWLDNIKNYSPDLFRKCHRRQGKSTAFDIIRAALMSPDLMQAISRHPVLGSVKAAFAQRFPMMHKSIQDWRPIPELIRPNICAELDLPNEWLLDLFGPSATCFSAAKAEKELGWKPLVSLSEGQKYCRNWLNEVGLLPVLQDSVAA